MTADTDGPDFCARVLSGLFPFLPEYIKIQIVVSFIVVRKEADKQPNIHLKLCP